MGSCSPIWVLAGALAAATGCNQVFGLEPPAEGDARLDATAGDGGAIDAPTASWGEPTKILVAASEAGFEDDPHVSPDGLELYFAYQLPPAPKELYRARRSRAGDGWQTAAPILELNGALDSDASPHLTADGRRLYFASNRPGGPDVVAADRAGLADPWVLVGVDTGLSTAAEDRHASPCDGRARFVLASNRPASVTSDLYEYDLEGTARPLDELNSMADDASPYLLEDCLTLYFSSNRVGTYDLYVATRATPFDRWSTPRRLDELATDAAEMDPWVSRDQRHLVYSVASATGTDVVESVR